MHDHIFSNFDVISVQQRNSLIKYLCSILLLLYENISFRFDCDIYFNKLKNILF